jgi:hypothetical protein
MPLNTAAFSAEGEQMAAANVEITRRDQGWGDAPLFQATTRRGPPDLGKRADGAGG